MVLALLTGGLFFPVPLPADDAAGITGSAAPGSADTAAPGVPALVSEEPRSGAAGGGRGVAGETVAEMLTDAEDSTLSLLVERLSINPAVILDYSKRIGIALCIIAVQILLIWLVWRFFDRFKIKLAAWGGRKFKPLTIKTLRILTTKQMVNVLLFGLKIAKYIVTAFQLFITIPMVFGLFPATRNLASSLLGYILNPLKNIIIGTVKYIPSLITIVIILVIARYIIRALKFFATQIERGRLVVPGFYADWAQPTFNILRVLAYAFTLVTIFPYLPGSGSPVFQGVTVFMGVLFSLGSSSAIGNLIAGLVITYMRPFKLGDRIQLQGTTGFVVEKTLMVVRLRTHKNEYVTFPNIMVLSSSIINYNTSSDENKDGLILHADVTMGYAVPWTTVHDILITAALKTAHVLETPKPFVLQTALDDFYARYQINAYTKEVCRVPAIYAELYQNLQDGFKAAGIDLTAPTYQVRLQPETPVKPPNGGPADKLPDTVIHHT
jgi:small-conductance mechanosensitive channel